MLVTINRVSYDIPLEDMGVGNSVFVVTLRPGSVLPALRKACAAAGLVYKLAGATGLHKGALGVRVWRMA